MSNSTSAPPTSALRGSTLLVFAHRDEAEAFSDVPHLVTGVGKVNAAGALAQALGIGSDAAARSAALPELAAVGVDYARSSSDGPRQSLAETSGISRVVVLGTAGVLVDGPEAPQLNTVYQVTAAQQHDYSLPSPLLRLSGPVVLPEERTAKIATGDVFVNDDAQRAALASSGAQLVDMETYAFASVCIRFGVPLQVFKVPSDFADSATTDAEWDEIAVRKSEQLRHFWDEEVARG